MSVDVTPTPTPTPIPFVDYTEALEGLASGIGNIAYDVRNIELFIEGLYEPITYVVGILIFGVVVALCYFAYKFLRLFI